MGFPFPVAREDSPLSVVGERSLCLRAVGAAEGTFIAEFPAPAGAPWDLAARTRATFWIRASNANNWGFQGAGPILRLHSGKSAFAYVPARGGLTTRSAKEGS